MTDIRVNHEDNTITITRKLANLASNPFSKEAKLLDKVRAKNVGYTIVVRTIKTNPDKDSYKGLTYDYMRNYIIRFSDDKKADLKELEDMIFISQCHSKSKRYPVIKKWFLVKYPDIAEFGVEKKEDPKEEKVDETKEAAVEGKETEEPMIAETGIAA